MIVITVEYEPDVLKVKDLKISATVFSNLQNDQLGDESQVILRPGDRVQHRLRLYPNGIIRLWLHGSAVAVE